MFDSSFFFTQSSSPSAIHLTHHTLFEANMVYPSPGYMRNGCTVSKYPSPGYMRNGCTVSKYPSPGYMRNGCTVSKYPSPGYMRNGCTIA